MLEQGISRSEKTLPKYSLAAHDRAGRNEASGRGILTRCESEGQKKNITLWRKTFSIDLRRSRFLKSIARKVIGVLREGLGSRDHVNDFMSISVDVTVIFKT